MQRDHDAHIRALLDHRQPRFSAVSDYEDAPSLYSPNPSAHDHPSPAPNPTSVLDLDDDDDDDPRASYADPYDDNPNHYEPSDDASAPARLSYLGPNLRFHSRAPWELEDGDIDEADEPEESPRHFGTTFPFARRRPSGSSSPRSSFQTTRPSGESSRSQVLPKRSFDTTSSQIFYPRGALYALAQESMSATSLGQVTRPPRETLRSKFSLGRLRPETPTGPLPPPPVPPISPAHSRFPPSPTFDTIPREIHSAPAHEITHPYANPELVVSYSNDNSSTYHNSLGSHYASSRNDSNLTVTEAFSTDSIAKSSSQATLTPDSSINSITSKPRSSAILAKNISSPVPVVINAPDLSASDRSRDHSTHGLPPGVSNLTGWTERNATPSFSLISLEEARAQRLRSTTTSIEASRNSSSSGSRASSAFPGEDNEASTADTSQASDLSPFGRARGRSVSSGSKAKSALQTIVGQSKVDRRDPETTTASSQPSSNSMTSTTGGRSLKHKKSGFMRLFNGGKAQEKDDDPPPVPSLPEHHVGSFNGNGNSNSTPQSQQRVPKSVQRIPVPSLSPSLYEAASTPSSDSVTTNTMSSESPSWKGGLLNQRRTPPALSIRTMPPGPVSPTARTFTSATADMRQNNITNNNGYASPLDTPEDASTSRRPWATAESQPQSAPAHVTEFPTLRLRPMSTLFSEHFSEHIVVLDEAPRQMNNDRKDPSPARSGASPMAPLTPPASALSSSGGAQSAISADTSAVADKQRQIWELEGQVRDLKAELEEVKGRYGDEYCSHCGRGKKAAASLNSVPIGGIVNRPRARTGTSSRFVNAMP